MKTFWLFHFLRQIPDFIFFYSVSIFQLFIISIGRINYAYRIGCLLHRICECLYTWHGYSTTVLSLAGQLGIGNARIVHQVLCLRSFSWALWRWATFVHNKPWLRRFFLNSYKMCYRINDSIKCKQYIEDNPCIIFVPHFGDYYSIMAIFAIYFADTKIKFVLASQSLGNGKGWLEVLNYFGSKFEFAMVDEKLGKLKIIKCLKREDARLIIFYDMHSSYNENLAEISLLGRRALISNGPVILAQRFKKNVVFVENIVDDNGVIVVSFNSIVSCDSDLIKSVEVEFNRLLVERPGQAKFISKLDKYYRFPSSEHQNWE